MKKKMNKLYFILMLVFLSSLNITIAKDLSDYPNFFMENGKLNVTIVVGDKSSSTNVIAQGSIAGSLSATTGFRPLNGLSSEMQSLNQNIISVGNPCVNPVSAQILNNPQPCDKDFPAGKAYIQLLENNGFHHLIVAGSSDSGTKKAAEALADYEHYDLEGTKFIMEVEGETKPKVQVPEPEIQDESLESDDLEIEGIESGIEDEDIEIDDDLMEEELEEPEINYTNASSDEESDMDVDNDEEINEEAGFFRKFIDWVKSLFS